MWECLVSPPPPSSPIISSRKALRILVDVIFPVVEIVPEWMWLWNTKTCLWLTFGRYTTCSCSQLNGNCETWNLFALESTETWWIELVKLSPPFLTHAWWNRPDKSLLLWWHAYNLLGELSCSGGPKGPHSEVEQSCGDAQSEHLMCHTV